MGEKELKSKLITDEGIIQDNKTVQSKLFVFLCNVIALCLTVLGIIAFIKGNM